MKRVWYLLGIAILVLSGCAKGDIGNIAGQHPLCRLSRVPGVQGSLSGCFFLGSGRIAGDISSGSSVEFWWGRADSEMIAVTLPLSKLHFIIDDTKEVPTVEFEGLDQSQKFALFRRDLSDFERKYPGTWLSDSGNRAERISVSVAVIRISRRDLENEVFLPSVSG